MSKKIWTYREAIEALDVVKEITEYYYRLTYRMKEEIDQHIFPENKMEEVEDQIQKEIRRWTKEINGMGIEVKGLWLVDFDNGSGYYCWQRGEETLLYEHSYEDGFSGRKIIKREENDGDY